MNMTDIIAAKRDGKALSAEEIEYFVKNFTAGKIPDYQASALLMAIYFNGMNNDELSVLTRVMTESGDIIDLSFVKGIKTDKHSSGGVGDKTTLAVAPMTAACGLTVAKMSGRGLGFSGGTIDKLESIPGFRTALSPEEFKKCVLSGGICIAGQTGNLAPADKKLYALRDVTATVESLPLIASSIMSKKLASGADAIVLDVKAGAGAFMKNTDDAVKLAQTMVNIGVSCGKKVAAAVTSMDEPLGFAVGNALEVKEAIETLKGNAPPDFLELCLKIGSLMLVSGKIAENTEEAENMLSESIKSGAALEKFRTMVINQGGNPAVIDDYSLLPHAKFKKHIFAYENGYVTRLDGEMVGKASVVSGAGRLSKSDSIDLSAGVILRKKIGDPVEIGDLLATVYSSQPIKCSDAWRIMKKAYETGKRKPEKKPVILAVIDEKGVTRYDS